MFDIKKDIKIHLENRLFDVKNLIFYTKNLIFLYQEILFDIKKYFFYKKSTLENAFFGIKIYGIKNKTSPLDIKNREFLL